MATIKSYTDLEQSKKLAEILPLESADYTNLGKDEDNVLTRPYFESCSSELKEWIGKDEIYPCWSLTALLKTLNFPSLTQNKEDEWEVCIFDHDNDDYIEKTASNPVDACYEMILYLRDKNVKNK